MPLRMTLEKAGYMQAVLRQQGYTKASFTHVRDKQGRPTGQFRVDPGPLEDIPLRLVRQHRAAKR